MAAVKLAAAALALAWATAAPADPLDRWADYISEASSRFGVPQDWIRRVMKIESGGRTTLGGRLITSPAGAMGLMQLMPATWSDMRAAYRLGANPHDPHDNIMAGAAYLRLLHGRFGYPGLFAAYNAGPRRYAEQLARGRQLPAETVAYVAAIAPPPVALPVPGRPLVRGPGLFVTISAPSAKRATVAAGANVSPLFIPLSGSSAPVR